MTGPHGQSLRRIQYYGIVEHNGAISEVLVTREHGRQMSQTPTGVTYATMQAAWADNGQKNKSKEG